MRTGCPPRRSCVRRRRRPPAAVDNPAPSHRQPRTLCNPSTRCRVVRPHEYGVGMSAQAIDAILLLNRLLHVRGHLISHRDDVNVTRQARSPRQVRPVRQRGVLPVETSCELLLANAASAAFDRRYDGRRTRRSMRTRGLMTGRCGTATPRPMSAGVPNRVQAAVPRAADRLVRTNPLGVKRCRGPELAAHVCSKPDSSVDDRFDTKRGWTSVALVLELMLNCADRKIGFAEHRLPSTAYGVDAELGNGQRPRHPIPICQHRERSAPVSRDMPVDGLKAARGSGGAASSLPTPASGWNLT